jgi:hypothetical protein
LVDIPLLGEVASAGSIAFGGIGIFAAEKVVL